MEECIPAVVVFGVFGVLALSLGLRQELGSLRLEGHALSEFGNHILCDFASMSK